MRLALSLMLLLVVAAPLTAQHLPSRLQWQPATMPADPRLDQPVQIDIIGRAAVPALELLSQATGVSLGVAPEDLNTVGERKLTIISRSLTLKAIMVQLPEALQEAHWDVDASGEEPLYLLHRNAGAEQTVKWLEERDAARQAEKQRAERVNRMEEAKRALQMPPEELAELEKTDPLLARSVQDPHARDLLEILLTLPDDQAERFRDTGALAIPYVEAPETLQTAIHRIAVWFVPRWGGEQLPEEVKDWRNRLGHATIIFQDNNVEHGWGVWVSLGIPSEQGYPVIHDIALHPRYCNLDEGQPCYTRLLVATGTPDEDTAFQTAIARDKEGFRADAAKREERHRREWIEPTDPDLLQTIVLGEAKFADFAELQAFIANETGISIVSDFFTLPAPDLSDDVRQGLPLWRLLHLIGEDDFRNEDVYHWQKRGHCLVFHRADWPALAKAESPEWLIADCRAKLQEHNEFTLDDLAEIAVILDSRHLPTDRFPEDLQRAGVHRASDYNRWALLLYASLTPDQKAKLLTPEGLSFDDMTIAQRQVVLDRAAKRPMPLEPGQAQQATLALVESSEERRGRRLDKTELQLRFPSVTDSALVRFKVIAPQPGG